MSYRKLLIALALPQMAGLIGALFTCPAISGWYANLIKPSFNPPNWIFGPVWTLLYLLMGIAFYLILKKGIKNRKAIYIFIAQLVLNSFWSIIFFGMQNPRIAFLEIIVLWVAILATILIFYKTSKLAAYLFLPYILWVSFAGFLNYSIWMLNQEEPVVCIMETKLCSDGSYVSKILPGCNFAPCPKEDLIKVGSPMANETVSSPLKIKGEARGFWFFEADFPIKLLDEYGNLIAMSIAYAKNDWMTEDFVLFEAEIEFDLPETKSGTLIFQKDNPSDLPEHNDELRIPIRFEKITETTTVKVFFNNNILDPEISCNKVFPVEREIFRTQGVAKAALEELLKGETEKEKAEGFFSNINSGVKVQSLAIRDGVAYVDFDERMEFQVGGSCRVSAIKEQTTETLKQFPTVDNVIISINGRIEDILQP